MSISETIISCTNILLIIIINIIINIMPLKHYSIGIVVKIIDIKIKINRFLKKMFKFQNMYVILLNHYQ